MGMRARMKGAEAGARPLGARPLSFHPLKTAAGLNASRLLLQSM